MLWPLVLPIQLTIALMISFSGILFVMGARRNWPVGPKFVAALGLPLVCFIPSCVATLYVVDYFRFGMFEYQDYDDINDFRVERYMPTDATDISVFKHYGGNGYRARFSITPDAMEGWHADYWLQYGEYSVMDRPDDDGRTPSDSEVLEDYFDAHSWVVPSDSVVYQGPVAGNGAGYTIHYSPSKQLAFLRSCYW